MLRELWGVFQDDFLPAVVISCCVLILSVTVVMRGVKRLSLLCDDRCKTSYCCVLILSVTVV